MAYEKFDKLKENLLYKRIVEWTPDKLILEDGTKITVVCSEWDCCACADGEFTNVKLDAAITDISEPRFTGSYTSLLSGTTTNCATVTIYHNNNVVANAECWADNGNGGYYYSVCSLLVNGIHYKVVEG
ncbi:MULTISPECIES: hypothetical protein [Listeria]|uniref:DUF7448 domain-containing protein n=1 Tax=Listeria TaxID=1637 RepID=UPI000B596567|nr:MULTISPECIES: hypothetical protein [Listeria]